MPDQPSPSAEPFDRLSREQITATNLARDREAVLGIADFLRGDLRAMREFPVGEAEPATLYHPAAER